MVSARQYFAAETERMMKLQDVLLKAIAKKITWWEAAEIIGVSDRTMRRWRERLETEGYSGLADRRKGKPSDKRIALKTVEEVLRLYRERYFDLKLRQEHGIELSYTWVQKALQGAGLVARGRGTVSIRYGPHVVGRYPARSSPIQTGESRGKGGPVETVENHKPVSHRSHRSGDYSPFNNRQENPQTPFGQPQRRRGLDGLNRTHHV